MVIFYACNNILLVCVCSCFTDSREETVLGSIPLPSYVIAPVVPDDHINRKYAFKVTPTWHWIRHMKSMCIWEHVCIWDVIMSMCSQQNLFTTKSFSKNIHCCITLDSDPHILQVLLYTATWKISSFGHIFVQMRFWMQLRYWILWKFLSEVPLCKVWWNLTSCFW